MGAADSGVDGGDFVMIDQQITQEIFSKHTKAIIWGLQPRAVQVSKKSVFRAVARDIKLGRCKL